MSRIRIIGHPYGDKSSASARIRFWNRLGSISDLIDLQIYNPQEPLLDCDVVYIQKRVSADTIKLITKAKSLGIPIVFDIDDAIGMAASTNLDLAMIEEATVTVVDTVNKKVEYGRLAGKEIFLVEDSIDYYTEPVDIKVQNEVLSVCSFGWQHSIIAALPYLITAKQAYPLTGYITNSKIQEANEHSIPFVQWDLLGFLGDLLSFHCAIVAHGNSQSDNLRSAGRLITSLYSGLLTLANPSQVHCEMLNNLGAEYLLVHNVDFVIPMIRELTPQREDIAKKLRPIIWERYSPRTQALKLYDLFRMVTSA